MSRFSSDAPLGGLARVIGWLFASALVCASVDARAAALDYSAPEACPARESVIEDIERLIGARLADVPDVTFELSVRKVEPRRYRASVRTLRQGDGHAPNRELDGESCAQATDAAAVAIALAIQGKQSDGARAEPKSEPTSAEEPIVAKPRKPDRPVRRKAPAGGKARFTVGASVAAWVDAGALPSVAPGGGAEFFVELGPTRFMVFGGAFVPQEARLSDLSGATFELALGGGGACFLRGSGVIRFAACAGFEAGAMVAEGVGIERPERQTVPWLAPRLEGRGEVTLSDGVRLVLGLGATFPLTRHNFVVNQVEPLHRASAITARATAGVSLAF